MPRTFPVPAVPGCHIRPRRWPVALLVGLALSLGMIIETQAATTWTVCASGCDYSSIKAAIAAPTTVDGDTLAIAAGTYTEPGITVTKSLTLQGEDRATTIVQAAASPGTAPDRVFTIPNGVTVTLQALTIRYGHANFGGGLANGGTLTLIHSTVSGNGASAGGGLSNSYYGTLTLTHSTVSSNRAAAGAAGLYNAGTLTLTHSTVSGNVTSAAGGGLYNSSGTLTLTHSTVSGNAASSGGGGLYNAGTLTLTHSTVSGNVTSAAGGGLYNSSGTLTLTHSTVSGNAASSGGGGLYNAGTLTLTHSTVSGNVTSAAGGGLYNSSGTLTLTSSLVAQNPDGGDCWNDSGAISSQGYNLDSDGSCHLTAATDLPGTDPLLGPLQNNGGPTLTHALLPGSPALDAIPWGANGCGTSLISDQRWQARPQPAGGACDIGAYEVAVAGQALGAWVTGFTPHSAVCKNVTTGQQVPLSDPGPAWDCEAAGLGVSSGDRIAIVVHGPVEQGATDVGGAVAGMTPSRAGCTNLTTGQQVAFEHLVGATAGSCVAAGLAVQPWHYLQMSVQGAAE